MKRNVFFIIAFAVSAWTQTLNWNGLIDTAVITGFKSDSVKWTKAFPLSQYEDIRVILKARDTAVVGFKFDSIGIAWGWLTFSLCQDTLHSISIPDTCYDQPVIIDTLDTVAMLKCRTYGSVDSNANVFRSHRYADTLGCAGWAIQSKWFLPEWDQYIKFFVKGIARNRTAKGIPVEIDVKRRQFVSVRQK
jgi:hypothetical protein